MLSSISPGLEARESSRRPEQEPTPEEMAMMRRDDDSGDDPAWGRAPETTTAEASPAARFFRPAHPPRLLPQAIEAEKALLSAILSFPGWVMPLCAERGVQADWFAVPVHALIYQGTLALSGRGQSVDFITLGQHLARSGELAALPGGNAYLADLFTFYPTAEKAGQHLDLIAHKYLLRRLIQGSRDCELGAATEPEDILGLLEGMERVISSCRENLAAAQCAPRVSLMDIQGDEDPRSTVLGRRFLCVGGGMLFVGPSGIGKSTASVQQDILWSLGREAFGIRPARPLRILTIQAENDAGDIAEMREGVWTGLGLSEEDRAAVGSRVFYEHVSGLTGADFLAHVDRRLRGGGFDLLRIDPLLAYLGGDVKENEVTAAFLRSGLNPILARHGVAAIVNHHTPKITNRDTVAWRASDWMYSGAGSADITNWARAALVIEPTHAPHVFRFIAAKRGARIGWTDEDGHRESARYFCHADAHLCWREATAADLDEIETAAAEVATARKGAKPKKTPEELKAFVPMGEAIPKALLLEKAEKAGFTKHGSHSARATLEGLIARGELYEWHLPRPGRRDAKFIARTEQTLFTPQNHE